MSDQKNLGDTYLGDGVYVSCESGMIALRAETFEGKVHEIFLEPEVYAALVGYARKIWPKHLSEAS